MIDTVHFEGRRKPAPLDRAFVDGTFSPPDAQDLASSLLEASTDFQELRNGRSHVQTGAADPEARRSVQELAAERTRIAGLLERARAEGRPLRLRATLELGER